MIGMRNVVAAGLFGLVAVALARFNHAGEWCRDAKRACPAPTLVDPDYLLGLAALGIVGLLMFMLVANFVFGLLRYRRSEG